MSCVSAELEKTGNTAIEDISVLHMQDFIVKTDLALGFEERGGHVTGCFNSPGEQGSEGPHQEECPS